MAHGDSVELVYSDDKALESLLSYLNKGDSVILKVDIPSEYGKEETPIEVSYKVESPSVIANVVTIEINIGLYKANDAYIEKINRLVNFLIGRECTIYLGSFDNYIFVNKHSFEIGRRKGFRRAEPEESHEMFVLASNILKTNKNIRLLKVLPVEPVNDVLLFQFLTASEKLLSRK